MAGADESNRRGSVGDAKLDPDTFFQKHKNENNLKITKTKGNQAQQHTLRNDNFAYSLKQKI